jgi:hypothetical protein
VVGGGQVRTGREQGRGALAFLKVADDSWLSMHALTAAGTFVLVEGELR